MAVNLDAELQGLARRMQTVGPGVQYRAAITEPRNTRTVQQMGIDAGDLRRRVGAQTKAAARQLIDQFEGLQIERMTGAREQRFEVFEQRWHDQFATVGAGHVEQFSAKFFDAARLRRQDIGNVLRQQPSRGHGFCGAVKNQIVPG